MTAEDIAPPDNKPPQSFRPDGPRFGILVVFRATGLVALPGSQGAEFLAALLRTVICRPLREKGLLCQKEASEANGFCAKDAVNVFFIGDRAIGLFPVNNLNRGLTVVKEEVTRLGFLDCAAIGYIHHKTGELTRLWPHESREPHSQIWAELLANMHKSKGPL